ncbi:MAG TPA: HEAT repeat domain-containing protein [Deltaproteobacteria bacterium]|nr:HEAT repeat domain-containing protein [Deltaproteobacteria bacterium]
MAHQHEEEQRDGISGYMDVAAMSTEDLSRISAYDSVAWAFRKLISAAKKTPDIPRKARHLVAGIGKSGKIVRLESRIERYEKKLRNLYYKIGKAGIVYSGEENVLETEPVVTLMAQVLENEIKIEGLKHRIMEIKEQKKKKSLKRKRVKMSETMEEGWKEAPDSRDVGALEAAIAMAVRFGDFDTPSEKEIFQKVANDLLDSEIEVRILAVAELGKLGKEAAVPILLEVSKSENRDLLSEVINSLISLGNSQAIPLFRERASDPHYRVRIGCLRGLYKLADNREDLSVLRDALHDDHPEVRRTAATFLGWKDNAEAAPALAQCLRDEDYRVRKAAVSALAHLKDDSSVLPLIRALADKELEIRIKALETIRMITQNNAVTFDVYAAGPALEAGVEHLRDWWEKERIGRVYRNGTGIESMEISVKEVETTNGDAPTALEETKAPDIAEMPAPEEADRKTGDVYNEADSGEDVVSK